MAAVNSTALAMAVHLNLEGINVGAGCVTQVEVLLLICVRSILELVYNAGNIVWQQLETLSAKLSKQTHPALKWCMQHRNRQWVDLKLPFLLPP